MRAVESRFIVRFSSSELVGIHFPLGGISPVSSGASSFSTLSARLLSEFIGAGAEDVVTPPTLINRGFFSAAFASVTAPDAVVSDNEAD